jgi:RNA polymerase-binding protein DksA
MSRSTGAAPVVTADSNGAASNHAPGAKKSKSSGLSKKFLNAQLKALEEERANYLRQAESLQAEADSLTEDREPGDVQFDEESGEGDTLAVERERDLALSAQARAAIEQIDVAIAKIKAGSYGLCENCGTTIPEERLEALPHAALCVKCKSGGLGLGR